MDRRALSLEYKQSAHFISLYVLQAISKRTLGKDLSNPNKLADDELRAGKQDDLKFRVVAENSATTTDPKLAAVKKLIEDTCPDKSQNESCISNQSPGLSMAIWDPAGKTVLELSMGAADLAYKGTERNADTPQRIASISKSFTGMLCLLLVRESKFKIEDPVKKYLPAFKFDDILIKHLIFMMSGLREYWDLINLAGRREGDPLNPSSQKMLSFIVNSQEGLLFPPGSQFMYCNSNYLILSEIIEKIEGKTFRAVAYEKIFKPLKMDATFFYDSPGQLIPGMAKSYRPNMAKVNGVDPSSQAGYWEEYMVRCVAIVCISILPF